MKSFLFHFENNDILFTSNFKNELQTKKAISVQNVKLPTLECSEGDIQISHKPNVSLLLLMGYISDAPCIPNLTTQQKACESLHELIELDHSEKRLFEILPKINGSFALIYVSFKEKAIYSVTDRISSRPLWYTDSISSFCIGSHCIPLAKVSNKFEYSAGSLAAYFLYGAPVDPTKSIFSNIYSQNEGSILIKKMDNPSKFSRWYKLEHKADNSRSMKSWATLSAENCVRAAERILRTTNKPLIFFSGGVDSRLVAASIVAAGGSPMLCTLGDSNNLEMRVAKFAANSLKCEHISLLRDEKWYLRSLEKSIFYTNGIYDWTHSHFSQAYSKIKRNINIDSAIIGDFAEAFSKLFITTGRAINSVWKPTEFLAEFDKLPLPNYRPINRDRTLKLFRKEFSNYAENQLNDIIVNRFGKLMHVSNDPLIIGDYFFRWQSASCLATFQMFNDIRSFGSERNIMFDKDLHELLTTMPSHIRNNSGLGSKIIRELNPYLSMIPNSNTLMPLIFPEAAHLMSKKIKPLLGKLRRHFLDNDHKTTGSWSHLPLLYHTHPAWKDYINNVIMDESTLLPLEIFDRTAVVSCWRKYCNGEISLHADIERILNFYIINKYLKNHQKI